jgi:hypothetical protein
MISIRPKCEWKDLVKILWYFTLHLTSTFDSCSSTNRKSPSSLVIGFVRLIRMMTGSIESWLKILVCGTAYRLWWSSPPVKIETVVSVKARGVNGFQENHLLVWMHLQSRSLVGCCRIRLLGQVQRDRYSSLLYRRYLRIKSIC